MTTRFHSPQFANCKVRIAAGIQQIYYNKDNQPIINETPDLFVEFKDSVYTAKTEEEDALIRQSPHFTGKFPDGSPCPITVVEAPAVDLSALELSKLISGIGTDEALRRILQPGAPTEAASNYTDGAVGVTDPVAATAATQLTPPPPPVIAPPVADEDNE